MTWPGKHEKKKVCGGLVLSDRKAHCEAIVERLEKGAVKILVATGQLIGESFDCEQLNTLFLATPIRFNARVVQYLGRVLQPVPSPGKKKAKVYDYRDIHVEALGASAKARERVFKA